MPLSRLRRPLFWVLIAYMLLLCLLRRGGFFDVLPSHDLRVYLTAPVEISAALDSYVRSGPRARAFVTASRIGETPCVEKLLMWFPSDTVNIGLGPGASLRIRGRLRRAKLARNPGGFDERGYLKDQGAAWVLHADEFEVIDRSSPLLSWAQVLRDSIERMLKRTFPSEISSVLLGIMLGDKAALDFKFAEALKNTGAFHLIVPSGTNVGFVLVFFLWLSERLSFPSLLRGLVPLVMAAVYGLVVGYDPPYLRAYLCAVLFALARFWDKDHDLFQGLVLSALLLLLWAPRTLFHPGFQMSYLAVLALLMTEPHKIPPGHWPRLIRIALGLAGASAAVQLMLLPLLAQMGGKFSLIGIFANVVLMPLCGMVLGTGFALWGISLLSFPGLFAGASILTGWLAGIFRDICLICGALPGAAVELSPLSPLMILGYYLFIFGLFLRRHVKMTMALAVLGLSLMILTAFWGRVRPRDLGVTALSLPGPGASLIRLPGHKFWLVYGDGPPGTVLKALKFKGIRRLDKIIFLEQTTVRQRYRQRILAQIPGREVHHWKARRPFEIYHGEIRFRFGPQGLRVFKGKAEYTAIPLRLRQNALEIATDGSQLRFWSAL